MLRKGRSVFKQVYCVVLSLSQLHNYTAFELICWSSGLHLNFYFYLLDLVIYKQAYLQIQCKKKPRRSKHRMSCKSQQTMPGTASVLPGGGLLFIATCLMTLNPATALLSPGFILYALQILHTEIRMVVSWSQTSLWSNKADSDWNKCFCSAARCLASQHLLEECGVQTWAHIQ